jgi:uncharacterized protein GlcG (DUF336 family)
VAGSINRLFFNSNGDNKNMRTTLTRSLLTTCAIISPVAFIASALVSAPAQAQQVLTEKQVSLAIAQEMATAAVEQCRKDGFKVAATVVDRSGNVKVLLRADGTGPHVFEASRRKAYTAAVFRVPTGTFAERVSHPAAASLTQLDSVIALQGGVPIKVGDEVIGAIGVGGAPGGDKDEVCANAGLQKVAEHLH